MNTFTTIIAVVFSTFATDTNDTQMPQIQLPAPSAEVLQIPTPDTALMQGYERYLQNSLEFSPTRDA